MKETTKKMPEKAFTSFFNELTGCHQPQSAY